MMDGSMKVMQISDKGMAMLMKKAKLLPRGTVIFMNNGKLHGQRRHDVRPRQRRRAVLPVIRAGDLSRRLSATSAAPSKAWLLFAEMLRRAAKAGSRPSLNSPLLSNPVLSLRPPRYHRGAYTRVGELSEVPSTLAEALVEAEARNTALGARLASYRDNSRRDPPGHREGLRRSGRAARRARPRARSAHRSARCFAGVQPARRERQARLLVFAVAIRACRREPQSRPLVSVLQAGIALSGDD